MRRSLAVVTVLLLALGLALFSGQASARRALETEIARALTGALPMPVASDGVSLTLFPPRVTILHPRVIREAKEIARADAVVASLALGPSLWEGEWFADLDVVAPVVAIDTRNRWWEERGDGGDTPSAKLRNLAVRDGRLEIVFAEEGTLLRLEGIAARARARGIVTPTIDFRVHAGGVVRRAERDLAIEAIAIAGRLRNRRVHFDELDLKAAGTHIAMKGVFGEQEIDAALEGAVALEPIFALIPEAGNVRGSGRVAATLAGSPATPLVSAELFAKDVELGALAIAGETTLRVRGSEWESGRTRARLFGGDFEGKANGRFEPDLPYHVEGRVRGWDSAALLSALDLRAPIHGALDGHASLDGRLLADEIEGKSDFELRAEDRVARGVITFRSSPTRDSFDLAMRARDGGELRVKEEITDRHEGELRVRALDLASVGAFVGIPLAGVADGEATIGGPRAVPRLEGRTEFDGLVVHELAIGRVGGPFVLSPQALESAAVEAPDLGARASGRLAFSADSIGELRLQLANADLARWSRLLRARWPTLPHLSGRLSGEGSVAGSRTSPHVRAKATAEEAMAEGESLGRVEASLERSPSASRVVAVAGGWDGDAARVDLVVDDDRRVRGRVEVARWDLGHLMAVRRLEPRTTGTLRLEADVSGTLERPATKGTFRLTDAEVLGVSLGAIGGEIRVADHKVTAALRSENRTTASIEASLSWPHTFLVRSEWPDLEISPAVAAGSRWTLATSGAAELAGDAEHPLRRGGIRVERLSIAHPGGRVANPRPWRVTIENGAAVLDRGELQGNGQRLVLAGRVTTSGYRLTAEGEADLALAEGWVPGLVSSRGRIALDLDAAGAFDEPPRIRGSAHVDGAAADIGALVGLTDVTGAFDFRDEGVVVRELVGAVGGGRFSIDGTVSQDAGYALRWRLQRASLGFPEWLDHRASGGGTLTGALSAPLVGGRIEVEQAIYDENVEWGEFLPWFRRQTRLPPARGSLPLRFDLRIVGDDGIFVDNNVAKIELAADLHLAGDVARPTMGGRIELLEGKLTFRERVFDLTSGDLRFDGSRPFDPTMDVRGESRIRTPDDEIEIDLHVSGTAESPRVEFAADDPTLGPNDLLALVTFGRTMSQLQQAGGAGVSLDELLSLTAGTRGSRVESRVQRVLPVDRIEIESAYSRTSGTTEPRVRIGKDLSATRLGEAVRGPLRASIASSLGTGRERDVTIEYGLTRSISLEGLWESQTESGAGAFGADVKFRLPFWGMRFSLLPEWLRATPPVSESR